MIIDHVIETVVLEIIHQLHIVSNGKFIYESFSDVGESWVWLRADFQSGSRVLKKVSWTFSYLWFRYIILAPDLRKHQK